MTVPQRPLGRTGLSASELALGCEPLGGMDWGVVDKGAAVAAVRAAWEAGVNVFDTADVYGLGESERRLATALGGERHHAIIVSKFGVRWKRAVRGRAETWRDCSPTHLVRSLDASLRRLQVDRIPIYLVHWPDTRTPIETTVAELERQRVAGKIGVYGVSNYWGHQLAEAAALGAEVVELPLNLLNRRAEVELKRPHVASVGVLAYGAYAQGLLCGRYRRGSLFSPDDRRHRLRQFSEAEWALNEQLLLRIRTVAGNRGVSMASVALRWVLDHRNVSAAIISAKTPVQLADAVGAFGWHLDQAEVDMLGASVIPPL
jgi:aryl-alcohol dehydrogenase-like predicted oxidoreductase